MPLGLFLFSFFSWSLSPDYGFRSARQILAVFFATRARNCILSDLYMFYTPRGGRTTAGSNAPGPFLVFTPPSGRGLVIPFFFPWFFYPAVRTGSSNTLFFFFFFFVVVSCPRPALGQNNTCR